MKKTLNKNDRAVIVGGAYPNPEGNIFSYWNFTAGRARTSEELSFFDVLYGDGLVGFLIQECTDGPEQMPTFEAVLEMIRLLENVGRDVDRTHHALRDIYSLLIITQYVEWLIDGNRAHSDELYAAWLRCHHPDKIYNILPDRVRIELCNPNDVMHLDKLQRQKNVLAYLRTWLSIKPDLLPTGISNEPLFDPVIDTNAESQHQPAKNVRFSSCPSDGQVVAEQSVPESAPAGTSDVKN
jgi:hypothetical protein